MNKSDRGIVTCKMVPPERLQQWYMLQMDVDIVQAMIEQVRHPLGTQHCSHNSWGVLDIVGAFYEDYSQ